MIRPGLFSRRTTILRIAFQPQNSTTIHTYTAIKLTVISIDLDIAVWFIQPSYNKNYTTAPSKALKEILSWILKWNTKKGNKVIYTSFRRKIFAFPVLFCNQSASAVIAFTKLQVRHQCQLMRTSTIESRRKLCN